MCDKYDKIVLHTKEFLANKNAPKYAKLFYVYQSDLIMESHGPILQHVRPGLSHRPNRNMIMNENGKNKNDSIKEREKMSGCK